MNLRDTRAGTILIAALVAAGVWYAKCPEAVHHSLSQMHFGIESENPNLVVSVTRVSWSPDSRKLLSVAHGEVGLDGPLLLHDLDDRPHRMPWDKGCSVREIPNQVAFGQRRADDEKSPSGTVKLSGGEAPEKQAEK